MPQHFGLARSMALVLLPFGACYFLAYTFRTLNSLVGSALIAEIGLSPAELGLLTSVYFLACALVQLPFGALLDRYGPRAVQATLLLFASGGALLFAVSHSESLLLVGRVLIGVGMSVSLMAGLKAALLWLPRERLGLANSVLIMAGALGSVAATTPAGALMEAVGWRGVFVLAGATAALLAVCLLVLAPRGALGRLEPPARPLSVRAIFRDEFFWRLAPLSCACVRTAWAVHGLWAAMWLQNVERFSSDEVLTHLFAMGLALCVGTLLIGLAADHVRARGLRCAKVMGGFAFLFIALQVLIVLRFPFPSLVLWGAFGGLSSVAGLSFLVLAEHYEGSSAGRVNACLNVLHLAAAFGVQFVIGLVVEQASFQAIEREAYIVAFGLAVAVQMAALLWYVCPAVLTWCGSSRLCVPFINLSRNLPRAGDAGTDNATQRAPCAGLFDHRPVRTSAYG